MEKGASRAGHAVLVSSSGMGHLIPFLGLAKRFSSIHSFKVTILLVDNGGSTRAPLVGEGGSDVSLVKIPAADISKLVDPAAHLVVKICALMRETAPSIRAAISGLNPTVVVLGLFATEYLPIAREFGLPCFVFVYSAWSLAHHVYSPVLDRCADDGDEFFHIPGCKPLRRDDVVDPMKHRDQPQYTEFMRIGAEIALFDGVLVMTWEDLEGSTLAALRDGDALLPGVPVYDIGPIVVEQETHNADGETVLMEWLDHQPAQSVIYISFGSGGALSSAQMAELALGLELSQQMFVWVVRPPMDEDSSGHFFGSKAGVVDSVDMYLPRGFRERTSRMGRLIQQWGPQSKVLSHPAVGGFLTHCGWNSIMESLSKGVPMMAWPLFAEQRMNAAFLVEELKVAVRASDFSGDKVVGREEIGKTVKVLLEDGEEGHRLRMTARKLQRSAAQALNPNGSSYNSLSQLVRTLTNQ